MVRKTEERVDVGSGKSIHEAVSDVQGAQYPASGTKRYSENCAHSLFSEDLVGWRIVIEAIVVQKIGGLNRFTGTHRRRRLDRTHDCCECRGSVSDACL